jgi:uncharacterized protein YycO
MYIPRPGDYGVVKTNGIVGKLIRVGTLSRWNHAVVCVDINLLVEAKPVGVSFGKVSDYQKIAWNQHERLTDKQRKDIVAHALDQIGKPYGFLDIFTIFLRILGLRVPFPKFWIKLAKRKGFICSELVAESYEKAGLKMINKPNGLVTPGDLAERLIYQ